jgi:hypothetical protein
MSGVRKKVNQLAVFKQRTKKDDNAELSKNIIVSARKTGRLNLSSRGMSTGICRHSLCICLEITDLITLDVNIHKFSCIHII